MGKNLMPDVAKLLGVELGEEFIIENKDHKQTFVLAMDGLHPGNGNLLSKVLQGLYELKKKPWEPKYKERYYRPNIIYKRVSDVLWRGSALDYALKELGMIYRTREEAQEHFAEDYERLTGKKLEG